MLLMLLIGWTVVVPAVVVVGLYVASTALNHRPSRHRPWLPARADVTGTGGALASLRDPAGRPDLTAAIRGPAGVGY